jgi:hypothetical protein
MFLLLAAAIVKPWPLTYHATNKFQSSTLQYVNLIDRTPSALQMIMYVTRRVLCTRGSRLLSSFKLIFVKMLSFSPTNAVGCI